MKEEHSQCIEKNIAILKKFVTPQRMKRMEQVLSYRTRHISVVLEDIYQPHNGSAVLRSCDAFGIQDVHIIQRKNTFTPNKEIALGSSKWLTLHEYVTMQTISVYEKLRQKGYKIVATAVKDDAVKLHELPVNEKPLALVFGSELKGLTKEAIQHADEVVYIPMFGFVESFNISVSVAIALSHLVSKLRDSKVLWHLNDYDMNEVLLMWLREDVHRSEEIESKIMH